MKFFETRTTLSHLSMLLIAMAAIFLVASCGDNKDDEEDPASPPAIGDARVTCEPAEAIPGVTDQIVKDVAVEVTDPDRDLIEVTATLNGIHITLVDDVGDEWFVWQNPQDAEPMLCKGQFTLIVEARDVAGHLTRETRVITK